MGKKEETTNLIGRKGSKMTVKSNVKTLAVKVYDEQIPDGWEKLKERIKELKKAEYQCLGIKHDEDVLGDDFFEPSTEKPHYHILIRVMEDAQNVSKSGKHVSTILNDLGIVFRKEDATMIANHGIETVGDFGAYATYPTHDTEKAINDGKQHYDMSAIVSNMSYEEILKIREGYVRVSDKMKKVTSGEIVEVDEFCYELGRQFGDFDEWYFKQRLFLRSNARMKHCRERYDKGIADSIKDETYVNRLCIFITGKPNMGKSYTSLETMRELGYERILCVDNNGTGKYDNLTPTTQAILIDDQTTDSLLTISDNKAVTAYRRGSDDRYFTGDLLIVTSNLPFEKWAKKCGLNKEEIQSAISRFFICELNDDGTLNPISCSDRGKPRQVKERGDRFSKFALRYDSLVSEYHKADLTRYFDMIKNRHYEDALNYKRKLTLRTRGYFLKKKYPGQFPTRKTAEITPEQTLEDKAKNWVWTPDKQ